MRKQEGDGCAAAGRALYVHGAAVEVHDGFHYGQPQAGPRRVKRPRGLGPEKAIENIGQVIGMYADARIRDGKNGIFLFILGNADGN